MLSGTQPKLCFYIPASPTDSFYSQVAMTRLALDALGGVYKDADIILALGSEEFSPIPDRWKPYFRNTVKLNWADPNLFRKYSYSAQSSARWKYDYDGYDIVIFCDADTLLVRPIDDLLARVQQSPGVMGVIAHYPFTWNTEDDNERVWREIARQFIGKSIDLKYKYTLLPQDDPSSNCPFYINFGFVVITSDIIRKIGNTYLELRPMLVSWEGLKKYRVFAGQIALALSFVVHDIPTQDLGLRYNYPNDPVADQLHPEELEDVRLIHYLRTDEFDRRAIFATEEAFHAFLSLKLEGSNKFFQDHIRKLTNGNYPFKSERSASLEKREQKSLKANTNKVIVVLGMHRSGTSAVTRSLQVLGVGLGDNLHPAGFDNPKGFWEDRDCIAINEDLLQHLGSAYDRLDLNFQFELNDPVIQSLYLKAVDLVTRKISENHGLWGVKDPRMCRLLGFWKKVFAECGCEVSYLISLRNPISVAESLKGRNNIASEKSYFLWLQHVVPSILGTQGERRLVVDYDLLLESPKEQVIRISDTLNIPIAAGNDSLTEFSEHFLEKGLRHSNYSLDQISSETSLPSDTVKAYDLLFRAAQDEISIDSREVQSTFERIEANLKAYALALQYVNTLEAERWTLSNGIAQRDARIAEHNTMVSQLRAAIADRDAKIANRDARIAERDQKILNNNQIINNLRQQLSEITSSTAWSIALRITRVGQILFPPGTRRKRMVHLAIQAIRTWKREGASATLKKTSLKIKQGVGNLLYDSQPTVVASPAQIARPAPVSANPYVPINEQDVDPASVLVKTVAFYLPQFHPIPENDVWWGKGFTEWTNVSKAVPNFSGHYQPHLPGELGFYDLRVPDVQQRQVELAKKYGIYGFCFYYYWFSGKRLLERPLDQFLANPDLDFPFCLCWANENWTRRWDGAEHEILIGQTHNEQEYLHFIQDISSHFRDPRYIRVGDKPMLLVYRIHLLPDPQKAARIWREECKRLGIGDLYLVAVQSFGIKDPRPYGFDAAVEFPPHNLNIAALNQNTLSITNPQFEGRVFDYAQAAQDMLNRRVPEYTLFKTVMPSWDNTARKQDAGYVFINASPAAYKDWLTQAVQYTKQILPADRQFVFVNAWNEWGEGTHLEPDRLYGYAYLQATTDAISSSHPHAWSILFVSHDAFPSGSQHALLSTIAWLKTHTSLSLKVLCLSDGELLPRFKALADTVLLRELQDGKSEFVKETVIRNLLKFCGGTPALIYGNSVVSGKAYAWLHELGTPTLTHVYELEMSIQRYAAGWIKDVLNYSTHFVVPSNAVKDNLVKNHAVDSNKITIVHGAVSDEPMRLYHSAQEKDEARKKLGLEMGKVLVVGCGWGMPYRKGADLFIELGDRVRRLGRTDFHFYWIGGFEDSESDFTHETWADHKAKLTKNDLGDFVTFLGYKENFKDYFQAADIFVLPSREDPLPLVAIEAAKYSLPLVCFAEAGGTPDLVGDDAGFVVPFEDVETMAEKILRLMDHPDLRLAMGKRARAKFLSQFSVERTTPALLSICRQVAGQKPAVSVIVPNYNCEKYLEKRLNSIIDQTFKDFELILIDDASTDRSVNILERYLDYPNVTLFTNNTNSGSPFRQWYKGFSEAKGDILWFAEADDFCEPDFLQKLLPNFRNSSIGLAYCNSFMVNEADEVVGDYEFYLHDLDSHHWKASYQVTGLQEINFGLGVKNSIPNASAVLLRKSCVSEVVFNETFQFKFSGDWFFYTQVLKGNDIAFCAKKLNYHRKHAQTVSSKFNTDPSAIPLLLEEASRIHNYILENYSIHADYLRKWKFYTAKQIRAFYPDAVEEEFDRYYPYTVMEENIKKAIRRNENSKRLVFLTTNDVAPNGGSEQLWIETALECRKRGHQVMVVIKKWDPAPSFFQRFYDAGIKIVSKGHSDFHQILLFNPDLVLISIGDQDEGIGWYEKCRAHDIPYVIINQLTKEPQYAPIRGEINHRVREGYLHAARVFFTCKNNYMVMEKRLSCKIPNAAIHYNPFTGDRNSFVPFPSIDKGLRLAIPANLLRIHKGQHLAIELFSHKKWRERPIELHLYGKGNDEDVLKAMANDYGLDNVFFHGHAEDLLTIWRDNHAIFMPSFMEGLPLVLVSAMLYARVPILTDVGAHREVVDNNINGFIAAKPTVEALDEALERAYQKANLWQEMGQKAREKILSYLPSHDPVDDFISKIIPLTIKKDELRFETQIAR